MLKKASQFWESMLFLVDCGAISLAWFGAFWLRSRGWPVGLVHAAPDVRDYLPTLLIAPLVWWPIYRAFGLFQPRRVGSRASESFEVIKASSLLVLLLLAASWMLFKANLSRVSLGLFWVGATGGLLAVRVLFREVLRYARRRGIVHRKAVIVGADEVGRHVMERLRRHPELGISVAGWVACDAAEAEAAHGLTVLGSLDQLGEILARTNPEMLFVSLSPKLQPRLTPLLASLENEMIEVLLVSDLYRHASVPGRVELFEGMPMLALHDSPMIGWDGVLKRVFDLVVGSLLLAVAAPILLVIALLLWMRHGKPILFRQERMGLDGRTFRLVKFRTMRTDAEEDGAVWSKRGDPRCTPLGAFLRRTSLDELPQLWNVVRGDMSLVGPRPERPVFVERFRESIPRYMLRHRVRAGLTGWAQVHGLRGDSSILQRLQYDLFYIEHWSLALDLKILWRTLWGGFLNKNA
jgi:Undecaprenyl-phosphate glucose phosphotransferase